ncbi:unnamed protein product [Agarophyton chilense]
MSLANLAENPFIIIAAYIAAFLPWTAFSAKDFISSKWKTVRTTRREGYINLIFSIVPAGYILFYCVIQVKGNEFSEMAAAMVAMLFALLHASRTIWGLWQLNYFRYWCKTSIEALDAMGIEYRLYKKQYTDAAQIADRMLVNDSIIDNQLLHGNTLCYLRYGKHHQQKDDILVKQNAIDAYTQPSSSICCCSRNQRQLELRMPKLRRDSLIYQRLQRPLSCVTLPSLIWDYLGFLECLLVWILEFSYFAALCVFFCSVAFADVVRYSVGLQTSGKINQVPLQPEEVWLNWSVVFAAQGMKEWISSFKIAKDPDTHNLSDHDVSANIREQRSAYFASEVLASAVMQLWPELSNSTSTSMSPFFWNLWNEESQMAHGRLVKDELLKNAVLTGKGLPFGIPHRMKRLTQRPKDRVSYRIYHRHLSSVKAGLSIRDEFCAQIDDFNVEKLEWLTITLNLGNVALQNPMNQSPGSDDSDTASEIIEDRGKHSRAPADDNTQALANLRNQLNWFPSENTTTCQFAEGHETQVARVSSRNIIPLSFPMSWRWQSLLSGNRHVLKVGEMIDAWLSLSAGDGIAFLLEVNPIWKDISQGVLPNYNPIRIPQTNSLSKSGDNTYPAPKSTDNCYNLHEVHTELEQRRLRYHFADEKYLKKNLNQFMTFMGYRMESVRTGVAQWLYQNRETISEINTPLFAVKMCNMHVLYRCKISTELSTVIRGEDVKLALKNRCVQTRLVWELQEQIEETLRPVVDDEEESRAPTKGPGSAKSILQCILSFPSLQIETHHRNCYEPGFSHFDSHVIQLESTGETCDSGQRKCDSFRTVEVRIVPICAPQDCAIVLRFHSNDPYHRLITSLAIKWDDRSRHFKWEFWRDAFLGRLEGRETWRKDHFSKDVDLFVTKGRLDAQFCNVTTPTGESFPVWKGWMPFRFEFCKFEVENSGLLRQQLRVRTQTSTSAEEGSMPQLVSILSGIKQHVVRYEDVQARVLKHAMLLVRSALPSYAVRFQRAEGYVDCAPVSQEDLLTLADRLSNEVECDVERVALLYESAALEHGRVDEGREPLSKCLEFLLRRGSVTNTPKRVVNVMTRYMASVLPEGEKSTSKISSSRRKILLEVVYPACERLVTKYGLRLRQLERVQEKLFRCLLLMQLCDRRIKNTGKIRSLMEVILMASQSSTYLLPTYADSFGHPAERDGEEEGAVKKVPLPDKEDFRVKHLILEMAVRYLPRDRDVLNSLGKLLSGGAFGVRRDAARAKALYERALLEDERAILAGGVSVGQNTIEGGHIDAMYNLANLLATGADGVPQDAPRAVLLYERAIAVGGHAGAMSKLGNLLSRGAPGVQVNGANAMKLYERAIEEGGRTDAMYYLANLLTVGAAGVDVNFDRAEELLEFAIVQYGNTDAMVTLAWLLSSRSVWCTEADGERAVKLFERAIKEDGRLDAMYYLGKLLCKGYRGVEADAARAFELFEKATNEGGRTEAMVGLALLLSSGSDGVEQNAQKAVTLYERAIKEGSQTDAMYNLALLLASGADGVRAQPRRAQRLLERAIAQSGRTDAMLGLAWLLSGGAGGADDTEDTENTNGEEETDGAQEEQKQADRDAARAVRLYETVLQREGCTNLYAVHALARLLEQGADGVTADGARAARLLEWALSMRGDGDTLRRLHRLRERGAPGLAPDLSAAARLRRLADAAGLRLDDKHQAAGAVQDFSGTGRAVGEEGIHTTYNT